MYRLEIGPPDAPDRVLTDADVSAVDVNREHTALSDCELTTFYDTSLDDHVLQPARLFGDGTLLFRGTIRELSWSETDGTTRVYLLGVERDLQDRTITRDFTNTVTWKAIRDVIQNNTQFADDVTPPSVNQVVTDQTLIDAPDTQSFVDVINAPVTDPVSVSASSVQLSQALFRREVENTNLSSGNVLSTVKGASGGQVQFLLATDLFGFSTDFTTDYEIPNGSVEAALLLRGVYFDFNGGFGWFVPETNLSIDGSATSFTNGGPLIGNNVGGRVFELPQYAVNKTVDYSTEVKTESGASGDRVPIYDASPATDDAFYLGKFGHFDRIEWKGLQTGTFSSQFDIQWEYFAEEVDNGSVIASGWRPIPNLSDPTDAFTTDSDLTWSIDDIRNDTQNGGDYVRWESKSVQGNNAVFVRARVLNGGSYQSGETPSIATAYLRGGPSTWVDTAANVGGLAAGTHTATVDVINNAGDAAYADVFAVYDGRFSYGFPRTGVAGPKDPTWAGPELFPGSVTIPTDPVTTDFNVIGANVSIAANDTSGNQSLSVSIDGGSTFTTASNATSVSVDDDTNVGTTINARVTLSRFDADPSTTPTTGDGGQKITSLRIGNDGSDLSILEDQTVRGTPFKVLQQLCRRAGFRFVADHDARDANGDLIRTLDAFKTGGRTGPSDTLDVSARNPTRDFTSYANKVTLFGERQNDGTRPTVTIQADDEINTFGVQPVADVRPQLKTVGEVRSAARSELSQRVGNRELTGTVELPPTDVLPGPSYPINWFGDGDVLSAAERVSWQESADGQLSGRIDFTAPTGVTGTVVNQGFTLQNTTQSI